ncbi:fungal-specific transcription factor domain-containing protein [Xylaria bambusicola]|uniref:fungal-specific transcription factor domain-containing protein n=1 Tax=Xylaria bambusicola TaxID=326684 RepID=UPI0020089C26|nr:fungal-specific transcription factor domain-containing protein [Xylaria bambusicola]KAI0512575.1 fungal-specific transcription factor domain-containing protein [Xylaria bambusicola]
MDSPTNDDHGDPRSRPLNAGGHATKRRRTDGERGVMRGGNELGLPRFIGSGSGIHLIRTVYDLLARAHTDQNHTPRDVAADLVPGEEDPSPSGLQTRGYVPISSFWLPEEIEGSMVAVNFDNLILWTENYFRHWHPIFPFLHGPAFLDVLEQVGERGIEVLNQADAIIVRSLLSISLADTRQMGNRRHPYPPSLLLLSQDDISASLDFVLSSPASISNIQAALCVELFLISMLNFSMASRIGGIIVRMSFSLGLHRCPSRYPNFNSHDAMMRKRLWWSIYSLDRAVCQTLGLPLAIQDDDVDVCLLSEELHNRGGDTQSNNTTLQAGHGHDYEQLQLLVMLSKHAKLRGMILELRNKSLSARRDDSEQALRVQAELKKWANEVYDLTNTNPLSHPSLIEDPDDAACDTSDNYIGSSHRILLVILQHELILSFYRPLLVSDLGTPSSQAAFQECVNASRAIIDTAARNSSGGGGNGMHLKKHGFLLWPSLTWSIWMSCFALTYAAMKGITTALSARRYADRALQVLKLLSLRKTSWPDKCILAVEQLISFLNQVCINKEQSITTAPRNQKRPQSKYSTETTRIPATSNQPLNPNTLQEGRRYSRPCQPRLDNQGTLNQQDVPSSAGAFLPATTDTQDYSSSNFSEFFPNMTHDYTNMLGMADPLIALDFANFAQAPDTQSIMDYDFGQNGFS